MTGSHFTEGAGSGAAFLSAEQTLLVADAHFGKAVSFRKLGVPVPSGTTTETLDAGDVVRAIPALPLG